MYRILNKQIFPALKQKQILTSVTVVKDLRKTTPNYRNISYTYRIQIVYIVY